MSKEENIPRESQNVEGEGHKVENPQTTNNVPAAKASDHHSADQKEASSPQQSPPEPQTTNYQPQTAPMEVHHPHHITHKKKWTEYLLEFLMLFLAVFLGFVAENIREHNIEQHRAKDFAKSMVQDLQNDTAASVVQKRSAGIFIAITDSLLDISERRLEGRNAAEFSFYTRFMYWTVPLAWNRATFEQIKNSGSLRYFKNYQLLEKLMKYDGLINEIEGEFINHQTRGNMLLN